MCLFMPPAKLISRMHPESPTALKSYWRFQMNHLFGFISLMYFALNCGLIYLFFTLSNVITTDITCERKIVAIRGHSSVFVMPVGG